MRVSVSRSEPHLLEVDAIAVPSFKDALTKAFEYVDGKLGGELSRVRELGDFTGARDEIAVVYPREGVRAGRVIMVGLGERERYGVEALRRASARVVSHCVSRYRAVAFVVSKDLVGDDVAFYVREAAVAQMLASYRFEELKSEKKVKLKEALIVPLDFDAPDDAIRAAEAIAEAVYLARDIANKPPNLMNPEKLEEEARKLGRYPNVRVKVLRKEELERLGMNGIVSVGKGSSVPPRLIVLEYDGGTPDRVAVVGKAVTFDAGGLDLKTREGMLDMKYDKSGGAIALALVAAAAKLGLKKSVVALIPAVENLPSGASYKPRDVIRMFDGTTVEVGDTDAEGRLIMADAIAYAVKEYDPKAVIDVGTLTTAIVIALGNHAAGLFGNDEELLSKIKKAAERVGERVWEMPLFPEYKEQLKSDVADLSNVGGRGGAASVAAAFLSHFARGKPWAHLDIAGTAWVQEHGPSAPYYPKGATAYGLRTLIELVSELL